MLIALYRHGNDNRELIPVSALATRVRVSVGYGLLASLIAAILLLAALSGITTPRFTSSNTDDRERSALSTPSITNATALRGSRVPTQAVEIVRANETPRWRSEIMDSYESVPSLAALTQKGSTDAQPAPGVAEHHAVAPSRFRQ